MRDVERFSRSWRMALARFFSAGETRQALWTGAGFALAFGWAWSGVLREAWLSEILDGSLFSGQGVSFFFGILVLCFLAGGFLMERSRLASALFASPALAHGAAILPFFAALLPGGENSTAVAACLGLAGGLGGLYWGSRLLGLAPAPAVLALTVAGFGITALVPALAALRRVFPVSPFLPLAAIVASSLLAWLAVLPTAGPAQEGFAKIPKKTAAILGLLFAALGALFSADAYVPPAGWLQCALETLGTPLALVAAMDARGKPAGRALPWAALVLGCLSLFAFALALHLVTGALLGIAVMRLARPPEAEERGTGRLAGRALLALFLALNAGFFLGARAALLQEWGNAALALASLVAGIASILFSSLSGSNAAERARKDDAPESLVAPDPPDLGLTRAEQRISAFLVQGLSNIAISNALGTAPATVRVHLRRIHKKMKTTSREDLVERLQAAGMR